tara:strand:+ start:170 stop:349 length:180 start_codon:yes stop_codon:yes gene_type:complete
MPLAFYESLFIPVFFPYFDAVDTDANINGGPSRFYPDPGSVWIASWHHIDAGYHGSLPV